jgi:hypothetical protein
MDAYQSMIVTKASDLLTEFYKALYPFKPSLPLVKAAVLKCLEQKRDMNNEIIHSDPARQTAKNKELLDIEAYISKTTFEIQTFK